MSIEYKLTTIAENTPKVYDAGYKKAKETFCAPINETGLVVQCCPLASEPFAITDFDVLEVEEFTVCGKNLYNAVEYPLVDGYYINRGSGAEAGGGSHTEYCATLTYIPVAHLCGKKINLNHIPGGTSPGIAFYDEYKVRTNPDLNGKGDNQIVPDGAVYMRFCTYISKKDEVQIEIGSVATSYEPYAEIPVIVPAQLPIEIEPLEGVNTIFAYYRCFETAPGVPEKEIYGAASVTVTGTTDPIAEHNRLKEYFGSLSSATIEEE